MLRKSTIEKIAKIRATEAKVLLDAKCPSGAMYLCGYAIELGLKAVIAGKFEADSIPDKRLVNAVHTHKFGDLIGLAGLGPSLKDAKSDAEFEANWIIVMGWSEERRYEIIGLDTAEQYVSATLNEENGVFPWIVSNW